VISWAIQNLNARHSNFISKSPVSSFMYQFPNFLIHPRNQYAYFAFLLCRKIHAMVEIRKIKHVKWMIG
jgi:hypothetical protein